ncbi:MULTISPECIES: diguanylate cyclase domain-containing protein [Cellvibrio]|uniref:Diguanylate cyclase (GGDEF)-like protein/PAS domain S-box-containing protein n=1 Tax=Cellvibrio fibrivorans TaxID=126350 RepID=A0ABU1V480_9GAMM|nr:diguanylate cyclase [Cellvibrio fibrivorans]MDR7092195.1 diguanylate cyclase (GGDEF)-like protein/PAS domain S-box-containing protein [Cellvibrio fibrivorans]
MMIPATHLLLIESNPADAKLIKDALRDDGTAFMVEWVTSLADALKHLAQNSIEVILLDLALPDGKGLDVFDKVIAAAPDALILVLSAASDDKLMRAAMKRGAHDYFAKGHIDAHWLPRALKYILERKVSRIALHESDERFRAMSDASPLGIFVSDAQGNCIYTNAAYHTISGQTLEETLGTNWTSAIHPDDRLQAISEWGDAVRCQTPFIAEVRFLRKDKSVIWTRLNAAAIRTGGEGKKSQGFVQIVEDISDRKSIEMILRLSEETVFEQQERAQVTLNSIGDGVLTTNLAGKVSYLNRVAETMTGWTLKDALGLPLEKVFTLIDAETRKTPENPIARALTADTTVKLPTNCLLVRRDGTESPIEDSIAPIHNRDNQVTGAVIVFHDVSETRAMAQKMLHMAQHDFLTGLANRALLTERLTRAVGLAQRKKKQVALLFIDLDNFKLVNDTLGHAVGDKLLQSVAKRMTDVVRATDTVCRQGGDEFVVLLTEIAQRQDAAQVAEKLITAFAAPHTIHECELDVTLSIGVSIYPDDGNDVESLFQHADAAMYCAKTYGRNNYQFYRADISPSNPCPIARSG